MYISGWHQRGSEPYAASSSVRRCGLQESRALGHKTSRSPKHTQTQRHPSLLARTNRSSPSRSSNTANTNQMKLNSVGPGTTSGRGPPRRIAASTSAARRHCSGFSQAEIREFTSGVVFWGAGSTSSSVRPPMKLSNQGSSRLL